MDSWIDTYLARLDTMMRREAEFFRASPPDEFPPVSVITYPRASTDALQVSFTAGLSANPHPKWKFARAELCIGMRSDDKRWGWAIGDMAYKLKGDCPFCYGDVVRFGTEISEESEMSAFVVFAPSFISRDFFEIELKDWKISLSQMYPIYEGEIGLIEDVGLEDFLQRPANFFEDPKRDDLSKSN